MIKGCDTVLQNFQEQSFDLSKISKGKSGIFRRDQEKIMLRIHKSWFLSLQLSKGCNTILQNFQG